MALKVIVKISIMYKPVSQELSATITMSARTRLEDYMKVFYRTDFITPKGSLDRSIDMFGKYCLKEYRYLIKQNSNKQVTYIISSTQQVISKLNTENNMWFDQLRNMVEVIFKEEQR